MTPPPSANAVLCYAIIGQNDMAQIFQKHALATGKVDVIFNHSFVRAEQHDDWVDVYVTCALDDTVLKFTCRYLIGADGGRSTVRKALGISLEGFTWQDMRLVAVNIIYDLDKYGWKAANFIVHPRDWTVIEGGDGKMLSDKAVLPIIKERVARLLPGNTDEVLYLHAAPYTVHQRCASHYRVDRIILAGDAAHLNNPVGGLGLTTGMLDASHLANALEQVLIHDKPDTVLDDYAELRRQAFKRYTDVLSTENLLRLKSADPAHAIERERYFNAINDPANANFKMGLMSKEMAISTTFEPGDLTKLP